MKTRIQRSNRRPHAAISLIQCLVYIGVLAVLLSACGLTLAKAWDAHRALIRNRNDIHRAMSAGERWRADIRAATKRPEVQHAAGSEPSLRITTARGIVEYRHFDGSLQRRATANGPWLTALERVRNSSMLPLEQGAITAWRWELEMEPAHQQTHLRALFTFTAVAPSQAP